MLVKLPILFSLANKIKLPIFLWEILRLSSNLMQNFLVWLYRLILVGIIAKVRHILPETHTHVLYLALVEPYKTYMAYCNIVSAAPRKTGQLQHLFRIQKNIVVSSPSHIFRHIQNNCFKGCTSWMFILYIFKLQLAIFMFKIINNLIPHTASSICKASSTIHEHFTRYRENLHILLQNQLPR